jgi:arylsulfatase A-like enzyme
MPSLEKDSVSEKPNVLFVLTDQMRAAAMGCMGNDQIRTPTLDRMADNGVLCTRNYSPDPVCTPARGSILTGQYPHTHRNITNKMRLPTDSTTLGNVFSDAGYETGYIGKWHLDGTAKPGHIPPGKRRQGFDYWKGFNRGHAHLKGHPHFEEDGTVDWEEGYQPALQADMATEFMSQCAEDDDPFLCYLSWGPPHLPYEAPDEYEAMYKAPSFTLRPNVSERLSEQARRDLVSYYGMITSLDDQMNRLLAALDTADVLNDTIVVFASDHGEMIGSHDTYYKSYHWEESIHVPLIWRYPDGLPEGEECDELTSLIDLFPTLCSLCDIEIPDSVQGEDLTGVLRGEETTGRPGIYVEDNLGDDGEWRAMRTQDHLLAVDRNGEPQHFYNTADDPYQQHNLIDLVHDKQDLEQYLIEASKKYDDRYFLNRIGELPN